MCSAVWSASDAWPTLACKGMCRQSQGEYARRGPKRKPCLRWEPPSYQKARCLTLPAPAYSMPRPTSASVPCQGQQLHLSLHRHNTTHRASLMRICPTCSSICPLPGEEAAYQPAGVEPDAVPKATLPLPLSLLSITSGPHSNSYWCSFPCRLHGACKGLIGCNCQTRCLRVALQGRGLRLAQQPLMSCRGQGRPKSYRADEWVLPGRREWVWCTSCLRPAGPVQRSMAALLGASCRSPGLRRPAQQQPQAMSRSLLQRQGMPCKDMPQSALQIPHAAIRILLAKCCC